MSQANKLFHLMICQACNKENYQSFTLLIHCAAKLPDGGIEYTE